MKSQSVISSWGGARRARPYAFTEQGVAMLFSVLRSRRAIEVNIALMRAFVKLRELLESNEGLNRKFAAVIRKLAEHDKYFTVVFNELKKLTPNRRRHDDRSALRSTRTNKLKRAGTRFLKWQGDE